MTVSPPKKLPSTAEALERFGLVLKFAGEHRLTDVLFKAGARPYYRRIGQLIARPQEKEFSQENLAAIAQELMTGEQMARFNNGSEVTLVYPLIGAGRFRVHIFRQRASIGLAVRAQPGRPRTFRELGLPPAWTHLCSRQTGLVLITSGADQGRTTTMGAMVGVLNEATPARRIVTVGNSIELAWSDKTAWTAQRAIGIDAPNWPSAVKGVIAQGADVIALVDVDDAETWQLAIDAAERGILVLATVAARDVGTAIEKILATVSPDRVATVRRRFAQVFVGATEQRLVQSAEGNRISIACGQLLLESRSFALIRDGHDLSGIYDIMHTRAQGMMTADQALGALMASGSIKAEVAVANAVRPHTLQKR